MRILIAEDDLASRRFITKFMSRYGECDATVDGIEVIEAFLLGLDSEKPYDLICLDVMMPKIDGIRAMKSIRELEDVRGIKESKRARFIVTTALGQTDYILSAIELGKVAYINKPIDIEAMEDIMRSFGMKQLTK